jgi:hypothetical protein
VTINLSHDIALERLTWIVDKIDKQYRHDNKDTDMKWLKILLLSFIPLIASGEAADSPLPLFDSYYSLYALGAKIGESTRSLVRQDETTLRFDSTSHTVGLLALFRDDRIYESSVWRWENEKIRPQRYVYRHEGSKKQRYTNIQFDWEKHRAYSEHEGKEYEFVLQDGMLDISVYQLRLMLDLAAEGPHDVEYTVIDGKKIKPFALNFKGEETLSTKLGDLKTYKFMREDEDKRRSVLWCAPDLLYLPVKVEHTEPRGETVSMKIDKIELKEAPEASSEK